MALRKQYLRHFSLGIEYDADFNLIELGQEFGNSFYSQDDPDGFPYVAYDWRQIEFRNEDKCESALFGWKKSLYVKENLGEIDLDNPLGLIFDGTFLKEFIEILFSKLRDSENGKKRVRQFALDLKFLKEVQTTPENLNTKFLKHFFTEAILLVDNPPEANFTAEYPLGENYLTVQFGVIIPSEFQRYYKFENDSFNKAANLYSSFIFTRNRPTELVLISKGEKKFDISMDELLSVIDEGVSKICSVYADNILPIRKD